MRGATSIRPVEMGRARGPSATVERGFTLVEMIVALLLLSLISTALFGVFNLASHSLEVGERRADDAASMRLVEDFLRGQWENAHPLRHRKTIEYPLFFSGEGNEIVYVSPLPARVLGGGLWLWRLHVVKENGHGRLVLEHTVPDVNKDGMPKFSNEGHSVLAERVASVTFQYYGIASGGGPQAEASWQSGWGNAQRLPQMVRMDVTLEDGTVWPSLFVEMRKGMEAGCRQWNDLNGTCSGV